jgi:hypothetical protein
VLTRPAVQKNVVVFRFGFDCVSNTAPEIQGSKFGRACQQHAISVARARPLVDAAFVAMGVSAEDYAETRIGPVRFKMRPFRRGGEDEGPEPPKARRARRPRPRDSKQGANRTTSNNNLLAKLAKPAAGFAKVGVAALVATGRFSLTRVGPWVGVLCVRVFADNKAFQALSCATIGVNAVRVRAVCRSVRSGKGKGAGEGTGASSFWKAGLLAKHARDATTEAVSSVTSTLTEQFHDASHPLVVLQDKVPFLFHPLIKLVAGPTFFYQTTPVLLKLFAPGVLRTLRFYGHLLPVIAGYMKTLLFELGPFGFGTKKRTDEKEKLTSEATQLVWDKRHAWGAARVKEMLLDMGGFYLKVGQVFATKSDLLPPQYIAALSAVFDDCPPVDGRVIVDIVEKDLGGSVDSLFSKFETEPIATATIAQVHVAYLNDFAKTKVAVKVQVPGSKKLMQMDMRNMLGTPRAFPKSATLFTAPL